METHSSILYCNLESSPFQEAHIKWSMVNCKKAAPVNVAFSEYFRTIINCRFHFGEHVVRFPLPEGGVFLPCDHGLYFRHHQLITYGHTYSKSIDQPGKVANPARGQLNREN